MKYPRQKQYDFPSFHNLRFSLSFKLFIPHQPPPTFFKKKFDSGKGKIVMKKVGKSSPIM